MHRTGDTDQGPAAPPAAGPVSIGARRRPALAGRPAPGAFDRAISATSEASDSIDVGSAAIGSIAALVAGTMTERVALSMPTASMPIARSATSRPITVTSRGTT